MSASSTGFTTMSRLDSVNHLEGVTGATPCPATTRPTATDACHCFRSTLEPRWMNILQGN